MNALFESFDVFAVAPNGVKKLRELILQLAVQGKLVPQDPNDEPASRLLSRFGQEKERMIEEGTINRSRHPEGVRCEPVPFEIPQGWQWVHLGDVGAIVGGGTPDSSVGKYWADGEDTPWVTPADMREQRTRYVSRGKRDITEAGLRSSSAQTMPKGTVLFSSRAPIGHVGIAANDISTNQGFKSCVLYEMGMSEFVYYFLRYAGPEIDAHAEGTTFKEVSGKDVALIPIPVPPLAEQHRIVAKVDQLMSLCDELETKYNAQQDQRQRLNAAALDTLLAAEDEAEFATAWQRVCDSFDLLYDAPESVTKLRQAILQLAVMGKLVKQDPSDEPASVLLKKIAAEKARLVAEGQIKNSEPLPPIAPDEVPFEVPDGWEWARMGEVVLSTEAGWSPQCEKERRTGSNWGVLKVSAVSWDRFLPEENKELPAQLDPRPEWEVHSGDFLMSRANTDLLVGKSVVVGDTPPRLLMSDKIIRVHCSGLVNSSFFNAVNNGPTSRAYYVRTASGTSSSMKNISRGTVLNLPVPVPPQAQQHRIMTRIDQLMSLCDELESKLTTARERAERLVGAVVTSQCDQSEDRQSVICH